MAIDKKQAAQTTLITVRKTDPVEVHPESKGRVYIRIGAVGLDAHADAIRELYRQLHSLYGAQS